MNLVDRQEKGQGLHCLQLLRLYHVIRMASMIPLLAVAVCLSINTVMATPISSDTEVRHYGVLLDAGSSSTKLKVYNWSAPVGIAGVPQVNLVPGIDNDKFKPGLSTLEGNTTRMASYLREILEEAEKHVPANLWSETPVFVLATAGFRLLSMRDAKEGMAEVGEILKDASVNHFKFKDGWASVLSGEEEGVYSWIAANYLRGFFDNNEPDENSWGVLEMGGGSTQIVFIPRDPLMAEEFQVQMAGRRYSLYVHSYLKFGNEEVKRKVAARLEKTQASDYVQNPCFLIGDTKTTELDNGQTVTMNGTGDAMACRTIFSQLLATAPPSECNLEPCAIGSVFQPSVTDIPFYATSVFYYPLRSLGLLDKNRPNKTLDLDALWNVTQAYCNKPLYAFENKKYASYDCADAVYIHTLLTGPYGFSPDTARIVPTRKVAGKKADWALGAMLELLSVAFTGDTSHCSVTRR